MEAAKIFIFFVVLLVASAAFDVTYNPGQQQQITYPWHGISETTNPLPSDMESGVSGSNTKLWVLPNAGKRGGGTALMDLLDFVGQPNTKGTGGGGGGGTQRSVVVSREPKTPVESWIWKNVLFKEKGV